MRTIIICVCLLLYGGGGGSAVWNICGYISPTWKGKLAFFCQAVWDKNGSVLINKPLTHLEKWIKGFVRGCPVLGYSSKAYLLGLGVSHLLPNKDPVATSCCLHRVPSHIRTDWIRHPRQHIHNAVLLLGGFGSLLSRNTLSARTFPWSAGDYIYPRLRHLEDSTSYPTVCT